LIVVFLLWMTGCSSGSSGNKSSAPTSAPQTTTTLPVSTRGIDHVFIVELENKGFDETWGEESAARYINDSLVPHGMLLTHYYGIGHASLGNYIAEISGQPPNDATKADCGTYTEYENGNGCVYPASVKTIADQLRARELTWKSYQEDMGTPCRHPEIGEGDTTLVARKGDQYATRHNPFVYFHSIIDAPECATNVVDLKNLDADLATSETTPNLVFITPNLCHDGHDAPCVDGEPGGLTSADQFVSTLAPKIMNSPAYKDGGMFIVMFDEAEGDDASSCCGQKGDGGGRTGALLMSPKIKPATINDTPYNHYALLCSLEDNFGLEHLGEAAQKGLRCFGKDVYRTRS
jgi:phospholipase C